VLRRELVRWALGVAVVVAVSVGGGLLSIPRAAGIEEPEPLRLRVLTYNIHHGEGTDSRVNLSRIAEVIESAEPDLVALQEVDNGVARTGGVNQPAVLGRLTGLSPLFGGNIEIFGGDYGNALLTKPPVVDAANQPLPSFNEGEQRGVIDARVRLEDGTEVRVLATHLDHRPDDAERLAAAKMINERATEDDRPALLLGDLNARPDSQVLATFQHAWANTTDKPRPTFPSKQPNRQIDYILVRPPERWRVVDVQVLDEPVASDHRPVLAVLELLPKPDDEPDTSTTSEMAMP